jgi:ABC-type sugar transport system ATPase subunit
MNIATVEHLHYWYPDRADAALVDVSLRLEAGLTVLAGPSGSGKSTLLRLFDGLVPHFHGGTIAGRAWVGGCDVLVTPTRRLAREVGLVFQDPEQQFVSGTVEREVAFGLEPRRCEAVPSTVCPAESASGLRWRPPWPCGRNWLPWTSRPRSSIPTAPPRSSRPASRWWRVAPPSSWPSTGSSACCPRPTA